jgi:hypothetical protein
MIISSYVHTPFLISPKGETIVLNKMYLKRLLNNYFYTELLQRCSFPRGGRLGRGSLVIKHEIPVNYAGGALGGKKIATKSQRHQGSPINLFILISVRLLQIFIYIGLMYK